MHASPEPIATRPRRALRLLAAVLGVALIVPLAMQAYLGVQPVPPAGEVAWGVTFSRKMCAELGIDWTEAYDAVVRDLRPSALRLIAYWDLVEPAPGRFDFRDLDRQVAEAEDAGIPVVIAVGQKLPRWPEYHYPRWLRVEDTAERQARLLAYLAEVVQRYRDRPGVRYWQVENEPFLDFGIGPKPDEAFFRSEVELVRRLDPRHPVLVTDGGEWGSWFRTARRGDVFGTTLYRKVHDARIGTFAYPLTPEFYGLKERLTKMATGDSGQRYICAELGAEPWGGKSIPEMTSAEQTALFPPEYLEQTVAYARRTRFREFYFWGVEWWYYRKLRGDSSYWEEAKSVIRGGAKTPSDR